MIFWEKGSEPLCIQCIHSKHKDNIKKLKNRSFYFNLQIICMWINYLSEFCSTIYLKVIQQIFIEFYQCKKSCSFRTPWSPLKWHFDWHKKFYQMQERLFIQNGMMAVLELALWLGIATGMHHTLFPSKLLLLSWTCEVLNSNSKSVNWFT